MDNPYKTPQYEKETIHRVKYCDTLEELSLIYDVSFELKLDFKKSCKINENMKMCRKIQAI